MSIDQQIEMYEERITRLEEVKRSLLSGVRNLSGATDSQMSDHYLSRINMDLDKNYEHMTILKIRKMMGF
jgi:hypothetical protein